ncbi:hypothetical protein [Lacihabitans soyangensis]|uniref:Uncharacterized protein n=1 Tax=Lacihabitans soyangensis TaxID=869394 RepID=A0AAE3H2S8_9BACT|nr:hypothetical protein [Lacihabitans soyangensis]MCP9762986.1 hypothetical protein [Lacihabitans soyangensis]
MVKVTGFQKRTSTEGHVYFALELQSDDLEFIVSQKTGRHYATVRKCWMSCTFNEHVCAMMVGKSMPGTIHKEACEPYAFVVEDEEITMSYRMVYSPIESQNTESVVFGTTQMQEA